MDNINKCQYCTTQVLKEDMNDHLKICSKNHQCQYCSKPYKQKKSLENHIKQCDKRPKEELKRGIAIQKKKRRKSIEGGLRKKVWETYIGNKTEGKCFCCWQTVITPFTYYNTFQAGHIQSHAHGGPDSIENLIPICRDCNMNMSAEDWDDYVDRQPHLPLRTYGANPPQKVIWATTVLQSLARMYLERKNPNSAWRLEWEKRMRWNERYRASKMRLEARAARARHIR